MAENLRFQHRLEMKLQPKLIMTPQLQQAIHLLQISRLELSQTIAQQLEENPLLQDLTLDPPDEENSPSQDAERNSDPPEQTQVHDEALNDLGFKWENYLNDDYEGPKEANYSSASDELPSYDQTLARNVSLCDRLLWQLSLSSVTELEKRIGEIIIGNIDDDGYLRASLEEVGAIAGCGSDEVEGILNLIQTFDPPGIGARDLKECLLIQTRLLDLLDTILPRIIERHLEDLEKNKYLIIAKKLEVSIEEVFQSARIIEQMEPKPGRPFSSVENHFIVPDVFVLKMDGKYVVVSNEEGLPRLRIDPNYKKMLRSQQPVSTQTRAYMEEKVRNAVWLIKSIEQRNRTIHRVAESIVKIQKDFLDHGLAHLRPMVLKEVSQDISMHESTVSRVTMNKYMHTPQGIFELKFFFNNSVPSMLGDGNGKSSVTVRELIRQLVSKEDPCKPLTDQEIVEFLNRKDIDIARRTVAKYRTWLHVPSSNKRKKHF